MWLVHTHTHTHTLLHTFTALSDRVHSCSFLSQHDCSRQILRSLRTASPEMDEIVTKLTHSLPLVQFMCNMGLATSSIYNTDSGAKSSLQIRYCGLPGFEVILLTVPPSFWEVVWHLIFFLPMWGLWSASQAEISSPWVVVNSGFNNLSFVVFSSAL